MSKKQIEEAIQSFGEIPEECRKQIEVQRDYYFRLIDKMEEYEWRDILTGIVLKEKEGDPHTFAARLVLPVKIHLFLPPVSNGKQRVTVVTLPSLLETKLHSVGLYMGPIGQKVQTTGDVSEEVTCPFRISLDKDKRAIQMIYM